MMNNVVIVDVDQDRIKALRNMLERKDYLVRVAGSVREAAACITADPMPICLVHFDLGKHEATTLLQSFKKKGLDVPSIVLADSSSTRKAIRCMKLGAKDFLTYPFQPEELLEAIRAASKSGTEIKKAESKTKEVLGQSPAARLIQKHIALVAPTDMSVIIQGDTGTGKEFVAREIVRKSRRRRKAFVAIDCGALPKDIAGSELFGHKKGAFTGAINDKKGSFEQAHRGTLFLDEIGNLSYQNQVRLLRVLQENKIKPLGGTAMVQVDVRVLAASNDNLWEKVKKGTFREDLFHRLNEFKLDLPRLSERVEDIPLFAAHFLEEANASLNKSVKGFDKASIELMKSYAWPGNLREMKNLIKRACLLCNGTKILSEHLRLGIPESSKAGKNNLNLRLIVANAEKEAITKALEVSGFNKTKAAKLLGIDRKSLYNKMSTYNL